MDILVSIIIPTYNRADLLGETIDSVLAQTYEHWECLIIDDRSSDYTLELMDFYCKKDFRIRYFILPKNLPKGANSCRNYGFEISKGMYINWFDSDDLMHPNKLFVQLSTLMSSTFKFSVCQSVVFSGTKRNLLGLKSDRIISKNIFYDYASLKIVWLTQAPLWEKEFLKNSLTHLFDEELQAAQEWEFHLRILAFYKEYAIEEQPLVYLRKHSESISYQDNDRFLTWNYFLARYKIYSNREIVLDEEIDNYFQTYLLGYLKKMVRLSYLKESIKALVYLKKAPKFKIKGEVFLVLALCTFRFFGRGDVLLKKVYCLK